MIMYHLFTLGSTQITHCGANQEVFETEYQFILSLFFLCPGTEFLISYLL